MSYLLSGCFQPSENQLSVMIGITAIGLLENVQDACETSESVTPGICCEPIDTNHLFEGHRMTL